MAVGASQDGVFLIGPQEGIWTLLRQLKCRKAITMAWVQII